MLFPFFPQAIVSATIRPMEDAVAVLLIHQELSVVGATVRPPIDAPSFHVVGLPHADVFAIVWPDVHSVPLQVVLVVVTLVG